MVLTTACPDTTGVVAAVAGFLAADQSRFTSR
jgi:formyltetrahydrofolate hydrolase